MDKSEECTKCCSIDWEANAKELEIKLAHISDENYHLKLAVSALTEVMMNGYKKFGFENE